MLFSTLTEMLKPGTSLNMILARDANGDTVTATIILEGENPQNFQLQGTPLELDTTGLAGLKEIGTAYQSLQEQIENTKVILEAQRQEEAKRATEKKGAKTASSTSKHSTTTQTGKEIVGLTTGNDEDDELLDGATTSVEIRKGAPGRSTNTTKPAAETSSDAGGLLDLFN